MSGFDDLKNAGKSRLETITKYIDECRAVVMSIQKGLYSEQGFPVGSISFKYDPSSQPGIVRYNCDFEVFDKFSITLDVRKANGVFEFFIYDDDVRVAFTVGSRDNAAEKFVSALITHETRVARIYTSQPPV